MRIDQLSAPAMATWQLTQDCNLACLHCCTDSAPGRKAPNELTRPEALTIALQLQDLPYVMVVGGEPTIVPWFWDVMDVLRGTFVKLETNGQTLTDEDCARLAKHSIRSIQVSIDGATQETYAKMRPGASLSRTLETCRLIRRHGLPLEITFAPSTLNLHEAERVVDLAIELGAFRFNTGKLMKLGTAAKLWQKLNPSDAAYEDFYSMLCRREGDGRIELLFRPFSIEEDLARSEPSATLLINPSGLVQQWGPIKRVVADLRKVTVLQAWEAYKASWRDLPLVV
jgi:MoaA/NifB/PqqE/SkfB family radical SAM enzyme